MRPTVLIVDDHPEFCESAAALLEAEGFAVIGEAADGDEAIAAVERLRPLGIDYSLFSVSRYREERVQGRKKLDAIATAGATAGRAVLFSGIAFVLAMLG